MNISLILTIRFWLASFLQKAASNTELDGDKLYVPRYNGVSLRPTCQPGQYFTYQTPNYAWSVARMGDYFYVADDYHGMQVLHAYPNHPFYLPLVRR